MADGDAPKRPPRPSRSKSKPPESSPCDSAQPETDTNLEIGITSVECSRDEVDMRMKNIESGNIAKKTEGIESGVAKRLSGGAMGSPGDCSPRPVIKPKPQLVHPQTDSSNQADKNSSSEATKERNDDKEAADRKCGAKAVSNQKCDDVELSNTIAEEKSLSNQKSEDKQSTNEIADEKKEAFNQAVNAKQSTYQISGKSSIEDYDNISDEVGYDNLTNLSSHATANSTTKTDTQKPNSKTPPFPVYATVNKPKKSPSPEKPTDEIPEIPSPDPPPVPPQLRNSARSISESSGISPSGNSSAPKKPPRTFAHSEYMRAKSACASADAQNAKSATDRIALSGDKVSSKGVKPVSFGVKSGCGRLNERSDNNSDYEEITECETDRKPAARPNYPGQNAPVHKR